MKNIFTSASVCFINIPYQTEPVIEQNISIFNYGDTSIW